MEGTGAPKRLILLHPNGSAVSAVELDKGNPGNPRAWNANGKPVNGKEVSAEAHLRYANQYFESYAQELSDNNP